MDIRPIKTENPDHWQGEGEELYDDTYEPHHLVKHTESKLFAPYRTVGHVSNHIPCQIRYINLRRENLIVTCTGRTLNTYSSNGLKLLSVSGTHPNEISSIAVDKFHVYTAANNVVYAWRRGLELVHRYAEHSDNIVLLLPYERHLLSLDACGEFIMRNIREEEVVWKVQLGSKYSYPTCIMHPNTYLNKVIVGNRSGEIRLFSTSAAKVLWEYRFETGITSICQSPGLHIVAVALEDKRIVFVHLEMGVELFDLKCIDKPRSLGFRTDGVEFLVVGSDIGSLTVFSLESREIISHQTNAHSGPIEGLEVFPSEPIFITSSSDNSLKEWIFDAPDNGFRLLSYRDGHGKPLNKIRFYGFPGFNLLSSGSDGTFRIFHIHNETYSRCFSKTSLQNSNTVDVTLQKSPITDFTAESATNPNHFANIAACHKGLDYLSTWSFSNTKRGDKFLLSKNTEAHSKKKETPCCLHMSSCGQFVITGYSNGSLVLFNIQSGIHRKTYGNPAHKGPVRGVCIDKVNTNVVSGGADYTVKFWNFHTTKLRRVITFSSAVCSMDSQRLGTLVSSVFDDGSIVVLDLITMKIFRRFEESRIPILCSTFSSDNRWLTASTEDCIVRTWDLVTSNLIDAFRVESMVKTMDYSPNGELLAIALHDSCGIILLINKTLFAHISLISLPPDYVPPALDSPPLLIPKIQDQFIVFESPPQIQENLITLTDHPPSKWKNLLNLDTIKMRNRPKQPPKTYVAPFFLSAINAEHETRSNSVNQSKILQCDLSLSEFGLTLSKIRVENKFEELCKMLIEMSPSRTESEIIALGPDAGGSFELLQNFLIFINAFVKSNRYYEASQAYLAVFLKVHGETVQTIDELLEELVSVQNCIQAREEDIQRNVSSVLAFTNFLKSNLLT